MHRFLKIAAGRLTAPVLLIAALASWPARALEIIPDGKIFASTQTMPATQTQANWNLSRLAGPGGGDGFVAWGLFGPTDMPTSSKVRTAWLEREIARLHDKLGNKDKIAVHMPRHFEPSTIAGNVAFTGEYEVSYPGRKFLNPIHIVPLLGGRGRFVVFGLMGNDEIVSKAAGAFAEHWAGKLHEAQ